MKESIKKAVKFLLTLPHIEFDVNEKEAELHPFFNFENPNRPYFVFVDVENKGAYSSNTGFFTKKSVNDLIKAQLEDNGKWDHIFILDVKTGKRIVPKI